MESPQPTTPNGRVESVESEPVSPRRSVASDEDAASIHEHNAEEVEEEKEREELSAAPATLLSEDPFSNESSRILFDSIGM